MAQEIERPLILNESIKDSIDQSPPNDFPRKVRGTPNSINSVVEEEEPIITPVVRVGKRWRVAQTCGVILLLLGFVFIFAMPPFIESTIVELAKEQVIMTPDNEQLWGHFPGKSESIIVRNFTFFALQNEQDFLLHDRKPVFAEVSGYKVQEKEDFINITYLDNGNKVKAKDWVRFFDWPESRNLDEKVSILNMGSLGYWSTLKQARPTLLLQQGLALLFTNMEQSILPTVLGQGISQQFLPNFTAAYYSLLAPAAIDNANAQFLWEEPAFGLSDKNNVGFWAQAAEDCFEGDLFEYSADAIKLKNYFSLTDRQTEFIMRQLHGYVSVLKELLLQNHYCDSVTEEECTGRYLSIGQLAQGAVTFDTPPVSTIEPALSICDSNTTCVDKYPELFAFYQKKYVGPKGLSFDREMVLGWFNYNNSQDKHVNYTTAENCLLHIGNLDQLWEWGTAFDKNKDLAYLQLIGKRFQLPTVQHSHVFWEWLKYLTHQFVLQEAGNAKLGMSTLFAQGFYEQLSILEDNLQPFLLSRLLQKDLMKQECHQFFKNSLDEDNNVELINELCKAYPDTHSLGFATAMVDVCEKKFGTEWDRLQELGVGLVALENHCDPMGPEKGLGNLLHNSKVMLDKLYKCNTTPYPYCSNFELALLQWNSAAVTSNPPEALKDDLPAATSFADWFKGMKPFEYWDFMHKFTKKERENFPIFSMKELFQMFTFEGWLSSSVVLSKLAQNSFVEYLLKYIRWICIQVTLNGFTTRRTPREILFGYEDEFLATVKNAYPPFGGDPSAPSVIAFNELNFTAAETNLQVVFATGKDDFRKVYQYEQIYGYKYLVNNVTWFDGNQTRWEWRSPWAEKDYFYGTSAKIFAPNQFEANNMSLLITQVQRYGSNSFYGDTVKTERFGIDVYQSFLNKYIGEVAPHNDKYYQTIPNVFNVSSIYGLPLYVTKNHFMNCTDWLDKVEIRSEDLSIHYKDISKWDDTFILVEPYTGVSFQSVIYLQNNYYHQPDELHAYPIDAFLPIFSICRGGNLTEHMFHELYDPLVMALEAKDVVVIVGIVMAVVGLALGVFATYRRKQLSKRVEENKKSELGISLQPRHDEEQQQDDEEEGKVGREEKGL